MRAFQLSALLGLLVSAQLAQSADFVDLRAPTWTTTSVRNVRSGVVQYTGDDTALGSLFDLVRARVLTTTLASKASVVQLKTADVRLSIPNASVEEGVVGVTKRAVPQGSLLAGPIVAILSGFEKNKSASAVFCVSIDGKDFLGNEAHLFRFGAESELKDSVELALAGLLRAIDSESATDSPACQPGWEGGQRAAP